MIRDMNRMWEISKTACQCFCNRYDISLWRKQTKDTDSLIVVGIPFQNSAPGKHQLQASLMPKNVNQALISYLAIVLMTLLSSSLEGILFAPTGNTRFIGSSNLDNDFDKYAFSNGISESLSITRGLWVLNKALLK